MPRDAPTGSIRCAIYTRKSTEEGLAQDFNSLHAQREACEAYVASQRHEGWVLVPAAFDDGGFSGGTLERPALARLLAALRHDQIDMIVVYKVDRLTRSLADFAKLVETLDAAGASFVSVTQSFNTSTSMGRLTLNMLLSFAQFEREVTAERIRDKIAASKRRGLWTGGPPPLGYDIQDKALVVNEAEAVSVRTIFETYCRLGAIRSLKAALHEAGIVSKRRIGRDGTERGGRPFSRGALEQLLRNPLYGGEVRHGTARYPGRHAAIIERGLFEAVQAQLDANATARRIQDRAEAPSLLTGMIRDATGDALTPSHASKDAGRLRYRYYVSHRLIAGHAADHSDGWRLPASAVEDTVRSVLAKHLRAPGTLRTLAGDALSAQAQADAGRQIADLADRVADGPTETLRPLLLELGLQVSIDHDAIALDVDASALARAIGISLAPRTPRLAASAPLQLRKRGRETRLIVGDLIEARPDPSLVALLVEARNAARALMAGEHASVRALAAYLGRDHRRVARSLQLAWLAPDIVEAILDGRQPTTMTVSSLLRLEALPADWQAQRQMLGFV